MMFACLYDNEFNSLGKWTQHIVSEWSLTRKAFEFDELSLTCKGFENSKHACYIGLHDETGKLKYLAFCGIPVTKNGLTTINGVDCRQLLNQKIKLDFTIGGKNNYQVHDVQSLYQYLLKDCLSGLNLGVSLADPNLSDAVSILDWKEDSISRSSSVQNLFDTIQAVNNLYDCIVLVEPYYDIDTNKYKLQFCVRRIANEINIKLSDYDVQMSLSQNITNQVICTDKTQSITYYLYNDNTIGTEFDSQKSLMPPRIETIEKDPSDYDEDSESTPFKDACIEGMELLLNSRYKDKVTIDLNTKLGSTLKNVDLTYLANITEYNPADPDSTKRLPVMSVKEDSKGNKQLSFGRLSDYWFMEEK